MGNSKHLISYFAGLIISPISHVDIARLLADFLGFGGALGIQVVVAALQSDQSDLLQGGDSQTNCTTDGQHLNMKVTSDSLTVSEFLRHRMVSVVIILLASLSQGAASQVSSHLV